MLTLVLLLLPSLFSFNLSEIAPVFLMAGVIMVLFINNPTVQKVGEVILGFGVLFMGLTSMSSAIVCVKGFTFDHILPSDAG